MAAQKQGKKIYHLNIGQPDLPTPQAYFDAVRGFHERTLEYEASPGMPVLIDAIRDYYRELDVELDPQDILITTGGSEALLLTCLSILDPYTEVIIPEPYYPNYTTFVHAAGDYIREHQTNPSNIKKYTKRERIESLITANTRAILITNPGNPTGVVLNEQEMRMIADISKKHNLFLICDEVYREFCPGWLRGYPKSGAAAGTAEVLPVPAFRGDHRPAWRGGALPGGSRLFPPVQGRIQAPPGYGGILPAPDSRCGGGGTHGRVLPEGQPAGAGRGPVRALAGAPGISQSPRGFSSTRPAGRLGYDSESVRLRRNSKEMHQSPARPTIV